jgi:hypothetical protein
MTAALAPLDIDATICRAVSQCSTQAALRHALGLTTPGDRAELLIGAAVHEALAAYLQRVPVSVILPALDEALQPVAALVPADDRRTPANVMKVMKRWFPGNPLESLPVTVAPELVEVGFEVPIGRSPQGRVVRYVGRLDAIGVDRQGDWWVVEHKTTGRLTSYWQEKWRLDGQVTGYVAAASQVTERRVIGAMIDAIGIAKVPGSTRKCYEHGVQYAECGSLHVEYKWIPVTRTTKQIEEWMRTVMGLAGRYEALLAEVHEPADLAKVRMEGTYNNSCPWCQYQDFCVLGRQVRTIEAMLVPDPWQPYTRAPLKG